MFKDKRGRIPRCNRIGGFDTNPPSAYSRKISPVFGGGGAIEIFVEIRIGGLVKNPLSPFSRKIAIASREHSTEIFDGAGIGGFDMNPISPFSRNVAIAFTGETRHHSSSISDRAESRRSHLVHFVADSDRV